MNIHICLVSDQLLANYIPAMMYRPDQVHLVSSDYVRDKGLTARFRRMLQQQDFTVVEHDGMPDADMQQIRIFAEKLGKTIDQQVTDAHITLNITGGNKLMVLGMWRVFDGAVEVIYTDTFHHCIEHLESHHKEPLRSILDIRQYLQAYGVKYLNAQSDGAGWLAAVNERKHITKYLAENAVRLDGFIGVINWLAGNALEEENRQIVLKSPEQTLNRPARGSWREALLKLQKAGLIVWDGDRTLIFQDVERTRYLGGIWLEEYVYLTACDAQPEHVAGSVKINWESSNQTTNELDVILVHRNRMLVIECKTLRFGNSEQKDSDMIYKISNLGDELRGLFGKTWLVSAREPDNTLLERAKSRHLQVIAPVELKNLRREILKWMG